MRDEPQVKPTVMGEWECDKCDHVIPGQADKAPTGPCPECGESAENSLSFYAYDDDGDSSWDDDSDDDE